MRGSITRRGRGWRVAVFVGNDEVTGRARYVTRTVIGTKREAERVCAELVTEVAHGKHMTQSSGTVGELLDRWMEHREQDLSPTTVASYHQYIENWLRPALGNKKLAKLQPMDIDRFYAGMRKKVSAASVRKAHTVLRAALTQAVKWRLIHSNPAAVASPPRVIKPAINPPDPADVIRLLEVAEAEDPEFGLFVRLAAVTGCRRGELCGLQWHDFLGTDLLVRRSVVKGEDALHIKETKTNRERRIALDAATIAAVEAQKERELERLAECGVDEVADDAFVFARDVEGKVPWRPDSGTTERFMKLRDQVGLPKVRLHDLRHFVATRLLDAGVPVRSVSERLGHASATTTLTIYAAALPATDKVAADIMGTLISRGDDDEYDDA